MEVTGNPVVEVPLVEPEVDVEVEVVPIGTQHPFIQVVPVGQELHEGESKKFKEKAPCAKSWYSNNVTDNFYWALPIVSWLCMAYINSWVVATIDVSVKLSPVTRARAN